jgi:hypothetical protein
MLIKVILPLVVFPPAVAQGVNSLESESVKSILLGIDKNCTMDIDRLVIMEIPGFPGKPVELAWFISITKNRKQKSLVVQYWSIPATSKEKEDLVPFLKKGIATRFSCYPTIVFKVGKYSENVLRLIKSDGAEFNGAGKKNLDCNSYFVGKCHAGKITVYDEERNFETKSFNDLLQEIDLWLVPHREKLLKKTINSVFGK